MPVHDAVARLRAAYAAAGFPPISPAPRDIDAVLRSVAGEIAPLRLPAELVHLWQLVDPATITVAPYPHLTGAQFALESWIMHRDEGQVTPRILFPLAYESWGFLFTELDDGSGHCGTLFRWAYGGSPYTVAYASVTAYLDLLATMVELGEYQSPQPGTTWVEFDPDERWDDARAVRLAATRPLPRLGTVEEVAEDARSWPQHWQAANGLSPRSHEPLGASATVDQLIRATASGSETRGRIHATVTHLAGSAAGCRVTVDDGTGPMDIWCPASVCVYGPTMNGRFEFEVVARPVSSTQADWHAAHREVTDRAHANDLQGAQAAASELYAQAFGTQATAEALAIRPLD